MPLNNDLITVQIVKEYYARPSRKSSPGPNVLDVEDEATDQYKLSIRMVQKLCPKLLSP